MKKRALSLLLAFVMVIGLLPGAALAAEDKSSVTIWFSAVDGSAADMPAARHKLTVEAGTGAKYGWNNAAPGTLVGGVDHGVQEGEVTALDALVAAHEERYGDDFMGSALKGSAAYVSTIFGRSSMSGIGFTVNDKLPTGEVSDGYAANEWVLEDGDELVWFVYGGEMFNDYYSYFDQREAAVETGEELTLTLTAFYAMEQMMLTPGSATPELKTLGPVAGAAIMAAEVDEDGAAVFADTLDDVTTDENGRLSYTFEEPGTYYLSAVGTVEGMGMENPIIMPWCEVTVTAALPDAAITVPGDAELFMGSKVKHFVPFTGMEAAASADNADGTTTYYFDLQDGSTYNFRVSGEDYVTYAGTFKKTAGYSMTVTAEQLRPADTDKTTVDHDTASNGGQNVGDLYLNINAQGHLKLDAVDDTYQIVNLRNWEAIDGFSANYFIEPDYHYAVLNEDGAADDSVVTVDENGLVTAVGEGTAIVLVTYDAINVTSASGGPFFGAIWPENTGVFVVSVGAGESGISTNMTINEGLNTADNKVSGDALDAEHDVIYFLGDEGAYTFTPDEGCTVSVANPTVDGEMTFDGFVPVEEEDGAFTVPLTEGRNIVKIEKDGGAEYQVITARQVSVTVNGGRPVAPGDAVTVAFDTLYHPANKLAGVYNMGAGIRYPVGEAFVGGAPGGMGEYKFASTAASQAITNYTNRTVNSSMWGTTISYKKGDPFTIPADYAGDTYTLTGGALVVLGYGDPYGNHRTITLENGKPANMNAVQREAILGRLPDIEIPIVRQLTDIEVTAQPTRTEYHVGDLFDSTGMVVTAHYSGGRAVEVTDYTAAPDAFTEAGEQTVTVSYTQGGVTKTAEVPVVVSAAELTGIEITAQPDKTGYQVGEDFDPAGMVVTARYSDGSAAEITRYTLSHGKLVSTDTRVTVTYNGKTANLPVTVTGRQLTGVAVTAQPAKTGYKVGEAFDPTGIAVTASYNDGTTADVTALVSYAGTDFSAAGTKTITVSYTEDGVTKSTLLSVTVTSDSSQKDTITVRFTLLGDESHGEGDIHTLKNGGLKTWIAQTGIEVPKNSTVLDVTARALDLAGISYVNDGNYISSIRGLAEFDNGPLSGWMYTLNGKHPDLGVEEQTVKNGDRIVFHYTDDYTVEEGSGSWGPAPGGSDKGDQTGKDDRPAVELPFVDVVKDHWALEGIRYVYTNGMMTGVSADRFVPDGTMTRAMMAAVLFRMEGAAASGPSPFADVPDDAWYAGGVTWASEAGIVTGTGSGFLPDAPITREQMATMLYRYAKYLGLDTGASGDLAGFADGAAVSDWAKDAVVWAVRNGLVSGRAGNVLAPRDTADRAQMAVVLMRFRTNTEQQ